MIRQARTYLVGAMSGASLIAVAIAVFVLLVSTQVFGNFPVPGLLGGDDRPSVSKATEVAAPIAGGTGATSGAAEGATAGGKGGAAGKGGGGSGGGSADLTGQGGSAQPGGSGGGEGGSAGGGEAGGGEGGSAPSGSGGSGSSSSGGSSGGGGGGGSEGSGGGGTTTSSPSSKVTSTVNETVNQVDETVTGGALEETGVTGVTEEVVENVAGPESTVGKVVDGTTETVEGILGK
jgi:hypothetical protein